MAASEDTERDCEKILADFSQSLLMFLLFDSFGFPFADTVEDKGKKCAEYPGKKE